MKSVLFTGATGFLGRRFLRGAHALPWHIRALTRREPPKTTETPDAQVTWFRGCLESGDGLQEALHGVDAVIHAAGGGRVRRPDDYDRNNARTTETLLRVVRECAPDLERFILVSSMAARGPIKEGYAPGPISLYGQSKARAELLTLEAGNSFPVTILRPPAIYGPGDNRLDPLIKAVQRGRVMAPSSHVRTSWVHVDDCIAALYTMLEHEHLSGQVFELEDGAPLSLADLVNILAHGNSVAPPKITRLPSPLLISVAWLIEMGARVTGKQALLTRDKLKDAVNGHWLQDRTLMEKTFPWVPRFQFSESYPWGVDAPFQAGETKKQ